MSGEYGEEKTLNKKRHLWLGAALGCVILLLGVGRAWENTYTIRVDTTGLQWVFRAVDKVSPDNDRSLVVDVLKEDSDSETCFIMGRVVALEAETVPAKNSYDRQVYSYGKSRVIFWQKNDADQLETVVSPEGGLPRVKAYWLDRETVSINGIEVELKYGYDDRRI